jgi:hypothetical protein
MGWNTPRNSMSCAGYKGGKIMSGDVNFYRKWKNRLWNDFVLFDLFTLSFVIGSISSLLPNTIPDFIIAIVAVLWIATTIALIFKKRTDEFSADCWYAATASAFALMVLTPLCNEFLSGFIAEHRDQPDYDLGLEDNLVIVQIMIFICVFQVKRLRGAFS